MFIEALINAEVLTREEVPDEYLQDSEGLDWKTNIAMREQIVALHLEQFRRKMEKVFKETHRVEYCLVFTSKMPNDETD